MHVFHRHSFFCLFLHLITFSDYAVLSYIYIHLCHMNRHNIPLCCSASWTLPRSRANNELAGKGADLNSLKKEFSETWRRTVALFFPIQGCQNKAPNEPPSQTIQFCPVLVWFILWGNFGFLLINANFTPKCFLSLEHSRQKHEAEGTSPLSPDTRGGFTAMGRHGPQQRRGSSCCTDSNKTGLRTWGSKTTKQWKNTRPRETASFMHKQVTTSFRDGGNKAE